MNESWEQYLLREANVVFNYLLKIGATKEDAEDVVQEAIMKTIECISQIQVEHLRAWLFKVALHRYYTLYNKKKSVVFLTDEELAQFRSSLNIEQQIIVDEQHKKLRTALQGLSESFSQLLVMKYFMELSYKEMAAILDVSENHIRTYLQRARKALRKQWEGM
jgi:RNA polymerase sigma-70 factor (ECF subfamily)